MNSIKTKLILVVVVAMTLISAILSWIAIDAATNTAFNNATQSIRDLSVEGADLVSARLEVQFTYLEGLSKIQRLHDPQADLDEKMSILINEAENSDFIRIGVSDLAGNLYLSDSYGIGGNVVDISTREYYYQSLEGDRAVMTPSVSVNPDDEGNLVMVYSVPMVFNGQISGVLVAVGDGNFLSNIVDDLGHGESGYGYIVDNSGTVIGHPRRELFISQYNPIEDARENEVIAPLAALIQDVLEKGASHGNYFFNERKVYASFTPIDKTPWILAVVAEEAEMMAGVEALRSNLLAAAAGMLFLGLLMALVIGHSFTQPVIHLEQLFTTAAQGDLTVRAEPKTGDEIGRAGRSFNIMMDQINELTYYDPVTHLPNYQALSESFHQLTLLQKPMTLYLFAADGFSRVNEAYGYQQGNRLLRMAAQRLQQHIDRTCSLYRGQSDEIILLSSESASAKQDEKRAGQWLEKLLAPYVTEDKEMILSFSVGLARYPDHGKAVEELLQNAGLAKNLAKNQGPGQVRAFTAEVRREVLAARELEQALALALKRNELFLVYQPIFHLKSGNIRGVEALLRWHHPEQGLIPPDEFIPLAEKSGLIHDIGQWVLEEACRQHVAWQKQQNISLVMAVNLSARQFESPAFLTVLRKILNQTGMNPQLLELELTESTLIQQVEESIQRLEFLRQMGLRISIDDFGTGYSSLSYMARMPVDTLKIDRSFITSLTESRQAQAIASTIMAMGHSLNLEMVAEGIETSQQLDIVRKGACQLGQGYYFSRPLPPDQAMALFKQVTPEVAGTEVM